MVEPLEEYTWRAQLPWKTLVENLLAKGGEGAVSGTSGSVRYLRPANLYDLDLQSGTLTIDTDQLP